jgi:PAS domain S-box-containing protein
MSAGEETGYLSKISIVSVRGTPEGEGPTGTALREGNYFFCNDIENAPEMAPWREAALSRNYHSSISLPIKKFGKVIGAFSVYADTKNFFDSAEIALLEEATGDISFALENMEKEELRKKAEIELEESRARYQTLTEVSPVGIFHTDASGYTTYVNPCWCTISGMDAASALGNGWLNAVHPEDKFKLQAGWEEASKNQGVSVSEYRFIQPGGAVAWVLGQAIPEKNIDNEIVGYVGTITEITERKKAEEAIEKLYKEKQTVLNRINDAMVSVDTDWRYTFLNEAALATHPLGRSETIGKIMWDVHPEMKGTIFWDKYHHAMQTGEAMEFEQFYLPMNTWFFVKIYPSHDGLTIFYRDITAQKKAAESIRANEQKIDLIYNTTQDVLYLITVKDKRYCFASVNKSFYTTTGFAEEQVVGKYIDEVIPEPSLSIVLKNYRTAIDNKQTYQWQEVSEYPTGTKTGIVSITPVFDANGECNMLVGSVHDITKLKAAEAAIRNNEEKRTLIMNAALDAIICIDSKGMITFWNPQAEKIFGWKEEEIMGKLLSAIIIPAAYAAMHDRGMENYLKTGHGPALNVLLQLKAINRTGIEFPIELTVLPIKQGDEEFFCAFIRDITERVKAQNEIINEKNLSDSVINSLPGVFYLYNRAGNFLRWNKNFETVTKYSAEEVAQMHPLDFFDSDHKKLVAKKIDNTFELGEDNVVADFLLKTKDKITYYFTGKSIEYRGEDCLAGVGIDFTERIRAQEKIRETTEQLRQLTAHLQSIREEERKRIGREIHDELGQQLTAIKMDVAWIDKKTPEDAIMIKGKLKSVISLLDGSNQSIRRILNELRPAILDDHGLMEALQWLGKQLTETRGIGFKFTSAETNLKLPGPIATCIFRVYQEALTNIVRHSKAKNIAVSLIINNNIITVHLADDGNGFDPLTVKNNKSFGILGMKERVLSLGGEFELISSPGNGTTISMRLFL